MKGAVAAVVKRVAAGGMPTNLVAALLFRLGYHMILLEEFKGALPVMKLGKEYRYIVWMKSGMEYTSRTMDEVRFRVHWYDYE
jgi:hypothetical protein